MAGPLHCHWGLCFVAWADLFLWLTCNEARCCAASVVLVCRPSLYHRSLDDQHTLCWNLQAFHDRGQFGNRLPKGKRLQAETSGMLPARWGNSHWSTLWPSSAVHSANEGQAAICLCATELQAWTEVLGLTLHPDIDTWPAPKVLSDLAPQCRPAGVTTGQP